MKQKTNADKVRDFMVAMGQPVDLPFGEAAIKKVTVEEAQRIFKAFTLALTLVDEEYNELTEADSPVNFLKELGDLLYVTYFVFNTIGVDADLVFARIHESNMSKLVDGKPVKREDGKILKGPNYRPPFLDDLVEAA